MSTGSLPLNTAQLESVITEKYSCSGKIVNYSSEVISSQKGFLSIVKRIDLQWSKDSGDVLPKTLALKEPTHEIVQSMDGVNTVFDAAKIAQLHEIELNAYAFFDACQSPPIPYPKFIYGKKFESKNSGFFITEFSRGYSVSLLEDYGLEKSLVLATCVAKLQAEGLKKQNDLRLLFPTMSTDWIKMALNRALPCAKIMRDYAPGQFCVSDEDMQKAVAASNRYISMLQDPEHKLPHKPALCIGDLQPNNVLWKVTEGGQRSNELDVLLDFQLVHVGSCVMDLSTISFWSGPPAQRSDFDEQLLTTYLNALSELTGGTTFLTLPELREEFRRFSMFFATQYMLEISTMPDLVDTWGLPEVRVRELMEKCGSIIEDGLACLE